MLRRLLVAALFIIISDTLSAQNDEVSVINTDTLTYRYTPLNSHTPTQRFNDLSEALESYMTEGIATSRPVRFSVIGGPGYSADTGLRLAVVGNVRYKSYGVETLSHLLSMRVMASLKGCYGVDLMGVNYIVNSRNRLSYKAEFSYMPTLLYGLDYDTSATGITGSYTSTRYVTKVRYERRLGRIFDVGVCVDYIYEDAREMDERASEIVGDKESLYSGGGIGLSFGIKGSRRLAVNVVQGVDVTLEAVMRPKFMGNVVRDLWQLSCSVDWYQQLWRGGLLALDLYGEYHSEGTPWMLRSRLGNDSRMRGYYPGRYNGNALITTQLELRQHVWEGLVAAVWGGVGSAFSSGEELSWRKLLPSYGVGIRWYMSPDMAIRIDAGFGRGCYNFVVGLNEAF